MLVDVPGVLSADQIRLIRRRLDAADAPWVDGRAIAGHQGAPVNHNRQIAEDSDVARELCAVVIGELERNPLFLSATPPRGSTRRCSLTEAAEGMHFGTHVDGAVRLLPRSGEKIRTDVSATLFLSRPDDYDGGELQIDDTYGTQRIKLPAGDLVLYPATSLHRVTPVTCGVRVACLLLGAEHGARRRAARAPLRSRHGGRQADARHSGPRVGRFLDRLLSQPAANVGGTLSAGCLRSAALTRGDIFLAAQRALHATFPRGDRALNVR